MAPEAHPRLSMTRVAGLYGAMAAVAWVLAWIFHVPSLWHMKPGWPGPVPPWVGLGIGIALAAVLHQVSGRLEAWFDLGDFGDRMAEVIGALGAWEVVFLAAASGLAEELLWRGALMAIIGLIPSALVFGAMHLVSGQKMRFWFVYASLMGLALGLLFQASGTLWAPILAHAAVNLLSFWSRRQQATAAA